MSEETISVAEATDLAAAVLRKAGASAENAASVAEALVLAECDGQRGHGLSRLQAYADQVISGKTDGRATPEVRHPRPATVHVDARGGFAFPAITRATAELARLAPETGIAAAAIGRSHHFGVAGHPVETLARAGLVGLAFTNSPAAIAPWGGTRPLFGTNPIAFAVPRGGADPVVVDLSLSKVARGKVAVAARRGETIPDGWALDSGGRATQDAAAGLAGSMLPAGDAKGAALAFMVEVLSAAFTGSNLGFEASSFFDAEGPPPAIGHLLLAIAPDGFGFGGFGERLEALIGAMTEQPGVRLSGARRFEARRRAREQGLVFDGAFLAELRARAD